jgi:isopentenyldiphosphate isomerase
MEQWAAQGRDDGQSRLGSISSSAPDMQLQETEEHDNFRHGQRLPGAMKNSGPGTQSSAVDIKAGLRQLLMAPKNVLGTTSVIAEPGQTGPFEDGQDLDELFDVLVPPAGLGLVDSKTVALKGITKRRFEVHRDGDWHRSIHLWVMVPGPNGPQLLLQQRAMTKDTHPGLWDVSVAGHIDAGGLPLETTVREAEEELGLKVAPHQLKHLFTIAATHRGETAKHGAFECNEVKDVYLVELESGSEGLRFSTGEVADVRAEEISTLLQHLRDEDARYVPRDKEYIEALVAALAPVLSRGA